MSSVELMQEGKRQMQICNACRYCEGYCAVWHAIEWRKEFTDKDMTYLANLCHDCRECVFACPFTTPHQFGVNPPKLFAELRQESYHKYALTSPLGKVNFWLTTVIALVVFLVIALFVNGSGNVFSQHLGSGAFYKVLSEGFLTILFTIFGLWMVFGWVIGAARYWRDLKSEKTQPVIARDVTKAIRDAFALRYLGKETPDSEVPMQRRWLHHFVFYGFLLDFASTTLGAFYSHVLHIQAPYPVFSPVVILGIIGGIGILVGTGGFIYVKSKDDRSATHAGAVKSGRAFSISLLLVAATGFLLLALRDTAAMGIILVIHLSTVASLFLTAPYTKFTHFVYRFMALVRYAQEERTNGV